MSKQRGFVSLIIVGLILLFVIGSVGGYYLGLKHSQSQSRNNIPLNTVNSVNSVETGNTFIGGLYTVKFPADYYIFYRNGDDFGITNKKWEGKPENYPSVGVSTYMGDIPGGMKLRTWLELVGTTQDWTGHPNANIRCKESKESLRNENSKTPYGGSDGKLTGDECLFFNIKNIKEITLPKISSDSRIPDLEILEFNSTGPAISGFEGTYTLITFGTGGIIQIDKKKTAISEDIDGVDQAYQLLKDTIKLN